MFSNYLIAILLTSFLYFSASKQADSIGTDNFYHQTSFKASGFDSLNDWIDKQENISYHAMLNNINPPGAVKGFFAASLSTHEPDYFYAWVRDSALVARVLNGIQKDTKDILYDYSVFQSNIQNTPTVCNCLGEPKFNPDGTSFTGNWGRPQNDGPAERAITMLKIVSSYKYDEFTNTTILPMILRDLYYVVSVWQQPCYDLWEEIEGVHFYTLLVMRRALLDGADYLLLNHHHEVNVFLETAEQIKHRIESFWDPVKNYIVSTQDVRNGVKKPSGLDTSVILAVNLASRDDGFFTPTSDKVLATAARIESEFAHLFPINLKANNLDLGTAIGRYPEDIYDGYQTSIGNPWFLTTAGYSELYYLAADEFQKKGVTINKINQAFFEMMGYDKLGDYKVGSAELDQIVQTTKLAGDRFLKTIQYHQNRNGSMSEQFDRNDGFMKGARDLTWSHAAFLAAIAARSGTPIV